MSNKTMRPERHETSNDEEFSNERYTIIVLQCLKRAARRPGSWLAELVIPRSIESDTASSQDIVDALEYAIDAVRAQREQEVQAQ